MSDFMLEPAGDMAITVTRSFRATPDRLRAAHLEADEARRWLGGPDMPLLDCRIDAVEGGGAAFRWSLEHGGEMSLSLRYERIAPEQIIHHETFDPDWTDGEVRVRTDFTDQRDGRTLLRLSMTYSSPAARDRVLQSGMGAGLSAAYDRLEALL